MIKAHEIARKKIKNLDNYYCSICGNNKNLVRHHNDYNKPEEVIIMCKKCHSFWHSKNKPLNKEKEKTSIWARVDKKLFTQLKHYADRNDEGVVSTSARKALRQFLKENK